MRVSMYKPVVVRRYGLRSFLFDFFMVGLTGGLWLIRIHYRKKFVR